MNVCTVDIETELIPPTGIQDIQKIFTIVVKSNDLEPKVYTYVYHELAHGSNTAAIDYINQHDYYIGHNLIKFDAFVLENLLGEITAKPIDTLLDAKMVYTSDDLMGIDMGIANMPTDLWGKYSLKAFGYRFGDYKIEFEDFTTLTDDMITYCIQDVELTYKLFKHLSSAFNYPPERVRDLEYECAAITRDQEIYGFYFDIEAANELATNMRFEKLNISHALARAFRPRFLPDGKPQVPAKSIKRKVYLPNPEWRWESRVPYRRINRLKRFKNGRIKFPAKSSIKWFSEPHTLHYSFIEGEYQKIKLTKFNPGSRAHIIKWLKAQYDWTPEVFTKTFNPKVDAETLQHLPYEEALPLKRYLKLVKDLSQLAETENSLIQRYREDSHSIHGRVDTLGTVTRRASHNKPNLGQVPKRDPSKGQDGEFRKLFTVPEGWTFVGADASALELKILAHYLYPYDDGAYDDAIENGDKSNGTDVHSMAQKAMGLPTRDEAKAATYAILYGASGPRVGWSLLKDKPDTQVDYTQSEFNQTKERMMKRAESPEGSTDYWYPIAKDMLVPMTDRLVEQAIYGYRVIEGFKGNLKGFSDMIISMVSSIQDDYIEAIDGGLLQVRSSHKVLNLLLQSAGSIAVKYWMREVHRQLKASGLKEGVDYVQMAYVHDELDFRARDEVAKQVGEIMTHSMTLVSKQLGLNVNLEAEYMLGKDWYTCH